MHYRRFHLALGLAAALLSSAAMAEDAAGWDYGPLDSGDACYAARFLDDDDKLMVGFQWLPAKEEFRVTFSGPDWDDLIPAKDGPLDNIELVFNTDDGPVTVKSDEGYALHLSRGVEAVAVIWYDDEASDLRRLIRKSSSVTVNTGSTRIGTFKLENTTAALNALLDCGADLGKK